MPGITSKAKFRRKMQIYSSKNVLCILKIQTNYKLRVFRTNFLKLKFCKLLSNSQATFNLENVNWLSNSNVNPKNGVAYKRKNVYLLLLTNLLIHLRHYFWNASSGFDCAYFVFTYLRQYSTSSTELFVVLLVVVCICSIFMFVATPQTS